MQFSRSIILDNGCYLFASELLPGTSKCVLSTCRLPDVLVLANECYQLAVIQQFISKWLPSTCNLHTSCLSKWVLSICSYLQQCNCKLLLSTCIPPLSGICKHVSMNNSWCADYYTLAKCLLTSWQIIANKRTQLTNRAVLLLA